jgi:hypothetical protein
MRLLVRACGAVVSVAMAVFAGCGGNVILDKGTGGTGGSGGDTGGTTSTTTPTTTSISTTSITTTTSISTTSITTTTTSITTTTTTGPSTCDNTGNCGDGQSGCIGCALNADCAQTYTDCTDQPDCIDYANCASNCMDPMCQQDCATKHPNGAMLYQSLIVCVLCVACANDCSQIAGGCPN